MKISNLIIVLISAGSGFATPELAVCMRWVDIKKTAVQGVINLIFAKTELTNYKEPGKPGDIAIEPSVSPEDVTMVQNYLAITTSSIKENLPENSHFASGLFHDSEFKDFPKGCLLRDLPTKNSIIFDCSCISMNKLREYTTPERLKDIKALELYDEEKHKDWISKDKSPVISITNKSVTHDEEEGEVEENLENETNPIDIAEYNGKPIKELGSEEIKEIDPDEFIRFEPEQIGAFVVFHLKDLSLDQFKNIGDENYRRFNEEQVDFIKNSEQLKSMYDHVFELSIEEQDEGEGWTQDRINNLGEVEVKELRAAQIRNITNNNDITFTADKIKMLEGRQIIGLNPEAIHLLSGEQIKSIKKLDLYEMTADQITKLTPEQIGDLDDLIVTILNLKVDGSSFKWNDEQIKAINKKSPGLIKLRRKLTDSAKEKNNSPISHIQKEDRSVGNLLRELKTPSLIGNSENVALPLLSRSDKGITMSEAWYHSKDDGSGILI